MDCFVFSSGEGLCSLFAQTGRLTRVPAYTHSLLLHLVFVPSLPPPPPPPTPIPTRGAREHARTHIHTHTRTHARTHTHTHTHVRTQTHTHTLSLSLSLSLRPTSLSATPTSLCFRVTCIKHKTQSVFFLQLFPDLCVHSQTMGACSRSYCYCYYISTSASMLGLGRLSCYRFKPLGTRQVVRGYNLTIRRANVYYCILFRSHS